MARKTGRKHRALEAAKHHEKLRALGLRPQRIKQPKIASKKEKHFPGDPENFHEEIGFVVPKSEFRKWDRNANHSFPTQWYETPGKCGCGCGNQTKLVRNPNGDGNRYNRFISGHQWLLRRRLFKPKGWKSSYEIHNEYEAVRLRLINEAAELRKSGKTVVSFDELRARINPVVNGKQINNNGISRMINIGMSSCWQTIGMSVPKLTSVRRVAPIAPISEFYPYISTSDTLVRAVNDLVPKHWTRGRGDICQDIILAILSGECELKDVPSKLQFFKNGYIKRFGYLGHNIVSMDAQLCEDGATLHEILSIKDSMTNITEGGMNWDVQQSRFEVSEQWDGEVCARY